jgi:hypothetical protein
MNSQTQQGAVEESMQMRKESVRNTLIVSQYGQVQGMLADRGLVLMADAETPRREAIHMKASLNSPEEILYLLTILRAVERRFDQVQLKDPSRPESERSEEGNIIGGLSPPEPDSSELNGTNKRNVYGHFANFLVYEQVEQGKLRIFFTVRNAEKQVARFDLKCGEVQAFRALAERALFGYPQIDLLLRDELSLAIALSVSGKGVVFDVQTPLWQAHFLVAKAHNLGNLAIFFERALNGSKTGPIRFENGSSALVFRRRADGKAVAEFYSGDASERLVLSSLQLYEMETLVRYVLHRSFDPESTNPGGHRGETVAAVGGG